MSASARERMRERALRQPGVRHVRRPQTELTPAFDLGYVRTGPRSPTPAVVIPGGPGLASVLPYSPLRRRAAQRGMDVLFAEHRGVGLSRTDLTGRDLPESAMTIRAAADDLAAVLDAEGVHRAIIYGSSYGSYLAQAFGAWHPDRVAGMVLDSVLASARDHRTVRSHTRELLWQGGATGTARAARLLRGLVDDGLVDAGEAGDVARIAYEFAGPETLTRLLHERTRGRARRTWRWLAGLGGRETAKISPFIMEFDLVAHIAFRELDFAPEPDGGPIDPATSFRELAGRFGAFAGEPLELSRHHPRFDWPLAVLTGDRDLRTPRPIAEKVVRAVPDGALLPLFATGHSALDTHGLAALAAIEAVRNRRHHVLAADPAPLNALRRTGPSRHIATIVRAGLVLERLRGPSLHRPRGT